MTLDPFQLAAEIKRLARQLGFDRVGITSARPSEYRDYFRAWLDAGNAAEMAYLANRFDERTDPAVYLPAAKSVICVAMNYFSPLQIPDETKSSGRVARYALGDDYHDIIKPRLHQLSDWIKQISPDTQTRCAVDTAPVMEKELAARAGLGWIGKNTCLINQEIGSWILLGEVLTTLELPLDAPATDRCGTCTRCLDACPTQAITAPYQLDAKRCISYLTIEHKSEINPQLQPRIAPWLYGCDICQDVCPWNRRAVTTLEPRLAPRFPTGTIDLDDLERWTSDDYRFHLRASAMKRVKLPVLQRNAHEIKMSTKNTRDTTQHK